MRIAILGDTHITRAGSRRLNDRVYRILERADRILHAGDIVVPEVLEDLRRFAPVDAVCGNNDRDFELGALPQRLDLTLEGVRVAMVHDAGPVAGREQRLQRWFPDARLVVYGHSHIPLIVRGDQMLLNPGSPTDKRRQPHFTIATATIRDARIERPRIVTVDP